MLPIAWHRPCAGAMQRILLLAQQLDPLYRIESPFCLLRQHFGGARCIVGFVFWAMFVLSFTTSYVVVMNKYRVLSNLILFNLLPSAFVDDLVMIYFFSFDLYTTWLDVDP